MCVCMCATCVCVFVQQLLNKFLQQINIISLILKLLETGFQLLPKPAATTFSFHEFSACGCIRSTTRVLQEVERGEGGDGSCLWLFYGFTQLFEVRICHQGTHRTFSLSLPFPMCVRVVFGFITVLVIVVVAAVFSNTIIAPALPGSTIVCT